MTLSLEILQNCSKSRARCSVMKIGSKHVDLPVFMPVGTQGTLKGLTTEQLSQMDCQIFLGNTYHLGHRPGQLVMQSVGGLHSFQNWDRCLLTDSGGFQMVSLLKFSQMTESGVVFTSPHNGTEMILTPEKSMQIQTDIGADIIMQLDDVVHTLTENDRMKDAMYRSVRWLDRCIAAHHNTANQNLFAIIQGGLDLDLRRICIEEMVKRDLPGYAIGGLSGGEDKDQFWRVVLHCTKLLPRNKPIYCMGVGYATDLVVCVALGVDMFDCVFPTRTARFGTALTRYGSLQLKSKQFANDFRPIEVGCTCLTCKSYTRAFLNGVVCKEATACHLISIHNVHYQLQLMRQARNSIKEDRFVDFVKGFLVDLYGELQKAPKWVFDALDAVGINF